MEDNISRCTLLRRLGPSLRRTLAQILEPDQQWKEFMSRIPDVNGSKYNYEHIGMIEQESRNCERLGMEVLLDEWSTTGRIQPNVNDLLSILEDASLYRAADYICTDWLRESPVNRPSINISNLTEKLEALARGTEDNYDFGIEPVSYAALTAITDSFNNKYINLGGRKLGSGAFGTVYLGKCNDGTRVAVKRLKSTDEFSNIQFETEVKTLCKYRHENILTLISYSVDGPVRCIVYEYMQNGSLQDRIACNDNSEPLGWPVRLQIALGTAQGICYLHTHGEKPMVHRDVKSANVLLDQNCIAKVGDCGLVRVGPTGQGFSSVIRTSHLLGTQVYMAPEGFRGDISTKLDTYSFGVVLFELLTGLPPYDESRETGRDLVSHMDEIYQGDITEFLDVKTSWDPQIAQRLAVLAFSCIMEKKERPLMTALIPKLSDLVSDCEE